MLTAQIHVNSLSGQTAGASFAFGFAHDILLCRKVTQLAGGGIKIPLHTVGVELDAAERIDIESLRVAFQIDPRNTIVVVERDVGAFRHGAALPLGYLHRACQRYQSALLVITKRGSRQVDRRLGSLLGSLR